MLISFKLYIPCRLLAPELVWFSLVLLYYRIRDDTADFVVSAPVLIVKDEFLDNSRFPAAR